jgi:hypothetical protein
LIGGVSREAWRMNDTTIETRSPLVAMIAAAPDAAFATAYEVRRAAFGAVGFGARLSIAVAGSVLESPPLRGPVARLEAQVTTLSARGTELRQQDATQARSLVTRVEPVITRVLERIVGMMPIEAVLARVDVNAIVSQVDVGALLARMDLGSLITDVLSQIELGDLISDSTSSIATDARDGVRVQVMGVDSGLERLVDRVLRRRRERDLIVPGFNLRGAT